MSRSSKPSPSTSPAPLTAYARDDRQSAAPFRTKPALLSSDAQLDRAPPLPTPAPPKTHVGGAGVRSRFGSAPVAPRRAGRQSHRHSHRSAPLTASASPIARRPAIQLTKPALPLSDPRATEAAAARGRPAKDHIGGAGVGSRSGRRSGAPTSRSAKPSPSTSPAAAHRLCQRVIARRRARQAEASAASSAQFERDGCRR